MGTSRQQDGQAGEDQALAYLVRQGLQLVERNFRCKLGEIDLIMQDRGSLVFVEVRHRDNFSHGGALASITPAKQRRLVRAARFYLLRYRQLPSCRFDAVAIDGDEMHWLRNVIVEGM